ncbi:hypothetical protein [Branchiibius sp. NY16-3462-2]|uniref:hypothetical protein n=1 Tax=Branchiibius sp. NY16-3462-2 TaxID=1807500 RepID=UPI00079BD248|nr:hypothetical protein [Branchiibius sp. NY16-3462-2]KYH43676.1 hypothetical protein AZH51_02375 [Branchiibius sp. NY16-3462-2]
MTDDTTQTPDPDVQEPAVDVETDTATTEPDTQDTTTEDEPDTFPRSYVEKLRKEAGDARAKAKDRDDLAGRLHVALVASTGRLADPTDLPFDEDHLTDPANLDAAIEDLLTRKPHLASRRPVGNIGQGVGALDQTGPSLAGILRANAR